MYKIKFIPTGHVFVLPKDEALKLKDKSPDEYLILEKNGKKVKDKIKQQELKKDKSILSLVIDRS